MRLPRDEPKTPKEAPKAPKVRSRIPKLVTKRSKEVHQEYHLSPRFVLASDTEELTPIQAVRSVPGEITVSKGYLRAPSVAKHGTRIGWIYTKHPQGGTLRVGIRTIGKVQIGLHRYLLAAANGLRAYFLGFNGRLWMHPHARLPEPCPDLMGMGEDERISWMKAATMRFTGASLPKAEATLQHELRARYCDIVRAHVNARCVAAAAAGFTRTQEDYAHGICEEWHTDDLVDPGAPDLMHALLASLALGLDPKDARELIELGAFIGTRVPLIRASEAQSIYLGAQQLLARLMPEWWAHTYLTDWGRTGSITQAFERQAWEILRVAWGQETDAADAAGVARPSPSPRTP